MRRLDAWVGKTLFHPPIILLCQMTGMTQFAVYRYIWWVVALSWLARDSDASWWWQAFIIAFTLIRTLSAGLSPDRPRDGSLFLRVLFLATLPLNLLGTVLTGNLFPSAQTIALLFAEYALTIRTIPPCPTGEQKRRQADATA